MAASTRSLPLCSGRCRCSHTVGVLGHGRDGLGAQVFGMRAGEAHPANAVDRTHRSEQLGEQRATLGEVAAVAVDVLAEQA